MDSQHNLAGMKNICGKQTIRTALFKSCAIGLFVAASFGGTALAQTVVYQTPDEQPAVTDAPAQPASPSDDKIIRTIVRTDPFTVTIKDEDKDDLSSCGAAGGEQMVTAFKNCWPILSGFQKYHALKQNASEAMLEERKKTTANPDYAKTKAAEDAKRAIMSDVEASMDALYASAKDRTYPMQDIILTLANLARYSMAGSQGQYAKGLDYINDNVRIFATSRIAEPEFGQTASTLQDQQRFLEKLGEQQASATTK